jgi:hypothetical protein
MFRCQKIISIRNLFRTFFLVLLFLVSTQIIQAQVIVNDSFENTTTLFTNSGGTYYSGNTAGTGAPSGVPYAQDGTYGFGISNGTAVITSSAINTSSCSSISLNFKLQSLSVNSTGNGADAAEYVRVEVSPDGGGTFYNTIEIYGNLNARWSYTSGTGLASTAYDGDATPANFVPGGGGARTTDGYSNVTVTNLPSVTNLIIRVSLVNNDANERWVIDNFTLSGTCTSCTAPTTTITPTTQTICAGSTTTIGVVTSAASPNYTWQASANGTSGWNTATNNTPVGSSYSGVNTSVLSLTAASTYYYRVLVSESGTCTATSATSTLVVNTPANITTQPSNRTTCLGSNAGFTIAATGSPLTYQWQVNTGSGFTNISNGGVYSGATTATLSLTNPPITFDTYEYRCVVTSASCNSVTSNDARLQIIDLPITNISPSTQTICAGTTTTINATTSAGSPSYTWQASANGTSGWNTAVNNTPSGSSYSGVNTASLVITAGNTYYYRLMVSVGGFCTSSSNTSTLVVNQNVNITSQPISVTTTSTGTAAYSVTASGTGNTYQWQQNSGSGFVNISNGGTNPTYAGATTSVLTISNPPLSMSGYSYQCIVSNPCNTLTTSGTSTITVTVALTCPYLISAVINSCDGCADEGNNEFVVLNSGSYSFVVNPTNVRVTYSNGPTNITSSFAAQPTSLATLNTTTMNACGTTFVDVSAGTTTVPPNSTLLIINKGACFTGDWSAYCGLGSVYVAFSSTTAWTTTGFFGNNTTARSFVTDFSAINSACGNTTYSYNQAGVAGTPYGFGTDGASVLFTSSSAPTYIDGNGNCAPPNTILPITLLDFNARKIKEGNQINWKVADEINIQKYIIEKSSDGVNFELLNSVSPFEQNSYEIKTYQLIDYYPSNEITYYKLSTLESDGLTHNIRTISINEVQNNLEALVYQNEETVFIDFKNSLDNYTNIQLIDLTGKLLFEKNAEQSIEEIKVSEFSKGIYFIRISSKDKIMNQKIVIH